MSYVQVQQLETVWDEYAAASGALVCLAREWHVLREAPEMRLVRRSHVDAAARNVEVTYIIRLFAEFEAILIRHLTARHPGLRIPRMAEALINRVSLRERIPDPLRDAAQSVREYRNSLVHQRHGDQAVMSIDRVLAALNRFLARLP